MQTGEDKRCGAGGHAQAEQDAVRPDGGTPGMATVRRGPKLRGALRGLAVMLAWFTIRCGASERRDDSDAAADVSVDASVDAPGDATEPSDVDDAGDDVRDVRDADAGPDADPGDARDADGALPDADPPAPPDGCWGTYTEGPLVIEADGVIHRLADLQWPGGAGLQIRSAAAGDDEPSPGYNGVTPRSRGGDWWVDDRVGCNENWRVTWDPDGAWSARDLHLNRVIFNEGTGGGFDPAGTWTHALDPSGVWFGFGGRTGPLDRSGTRMTFWATDAYDPDHGGYAPDADPLYTSIPFGIEVRDGVATGLFVNQPRRMSVDFGATDPRRAVWSVDDDELTRLVFARSTMPEVMLAWRGEAEGGMRLPPWALGYHQSRWGYEDADEVLAIAREFRARDLPLDAIWLDIQAMDRFRTFTFDPIRFADPEGMNAALEAENVHTVSIVNPGVAVDEDWPLYTDARDSGAFLRWPDGRDFVGTAWPGDVSFIDYTSTAGGAFWRAGIARLVEAGVDGIWLDLNEPTTFPEGGGGTTVPNEVEVASWAETPTTMRSMHNQYANLQASVTRSALWTANPGQRSFIVSRAAGPAIQFAAGVWTGDVPSTWDGLAGTWRMLLNLGVSGVPFVGSDIGGYSGHASPELFARWMQVGSVSPFARGHVTQGVPGQEPWQFGTEVEDISRFALQDRYALLPYLYSVMAESSLTGAPWLRPLAWHFDDDPIAVAVDDAAMLGPAILVAPVFEPGATERVVYLPAGRWLDWRSGRLFEGGREVTVDVTLGALPMFVREGGIVPRVPPAEHVAAALASDTLWLDVVPGWGWSGLDLVLDDGGTSDGDGYREARTFVRAVERLGTDPTVDGDTGPPVTPALIVQMGRTNGRYFRPQVRDVVRVRPVDTIPAEVRFEDRDTNVVTVLPELDGLPDDPTVAGWWFDANARSVEVAIPFVPELRRGGWTVEMDTTFATAEAPPVRVDFRVRVPDGTPVDPPIHFAGEPTDWDHVPLEWAVPGEVAVGSIEVPRGEWFEWKFTRGSWDTVEKWPDCVEATNRYAYGEAGLREETVYGWRDACDE